MCSSDLSLFTPEEGRLGVVVTFLSILELAKEMLIEIVQEQAMAPIYVKSLALPAEDDMAANDDHITPLIPLPEITSAQGEEAE